jgi:type IV secretion system protein VirB10
MKITRTNTGLLLLAGALIVTGSVLGFGQFVAENRADEEVSTAAEPQPTELGASADESQINQRELELAEQKRTLEERLEALEAREAELKQQERSKPAEAPKITRRPRRGLPEVVQVASRPEPEQRTVTVTVPASTGIEVEFLAGLSSEEALAGDPVETFVVNDVMQDGRVVIPAGSVVAGLVTDVQPAKKIGGRARLALDFDTLRLTSGNEVAIRSSVEFVGKKQTGKDAATIGGSAAGGAILGRVLSGDDKDKGTVLGAVVGAAIGTAVAAKNKTDPVLIDSGEITELLLYEPVVLTFTETVLAPAMARSR